jgi:hypothetical protein
MTQQQPTEDTQLAIDTIERRIVFLSDIIHHPSPDKRTAHWRDRAELDALRLSLKAIKRMRDEHANLQTLVEAAEALEQMLERVRDEGVVKSGELERWCSASEKLDALIEGFDGA